MPAKPPPRAEDVVSAVEAPPARPAPPPAPAAPPPPPRADATVVEYLNAFCPHCRVTHARFDRVTEHAGLVVRFRRVYTWGGAAPPLWARVCVAARGQGLEDRVFAEMLHAADDGPADVWEAARRAGADLEAVRLALDAPETNQRLALHRQAVANARLRGLPTLDIGRRRLMGEQSEGEIAEALAAARALTRGR
jgi:predicted DsbA family dithiol-disulfide isomerase